VRYRGIALTTPDMKRIRSTETNAVAPRYIVAALFLFIFISQFKDDQAAISATRFWSSLSTNPYIAILKSNAVVAVVPLAGLAIASLLTLRRLAFRVLPISLLFILLSLVATLRGLLGDQDSGYKTLNSCIIFTAATIYISILVGTIGSEKYRSILISALTYSAIFLIGCNGFNYFTGFGFVSGNPRLFGTTIHPNFMGVQAAIACLLIMARITSAQRFISRLFLIFFLLVGVLILRETGSRTAGIIFLVGTFVYFWAKSRFALSRASIIGLCFIIVISVVIAAGPDSVLGSSFDRGFGSGDTRSSALANLFDQISLNPFFGAGYFAGSSENSYLRGWAAYGIIYELVLLTIVLRILYLAVRSARLHKKNENLSLFAALSFGLAIGALLEGYLVDNFSYPCLVWFLVGTPLLPIPSGENMRQQISGRSKIGDRVAA